SQSHRHETSESDITFLRRPSSASADEWEEKGWNSTGISSCQPACSKGLSLRGTLEEVAAQLLQWPQTPSIFLCPFFLPSAVPPLSWRIIHRERAGLCCAQAPL
ncbi:unnamed protein product, partial [Staurois parvus]